MYVTLQDNVYIKQDVNLIVKLDCMLHNSTMYILNKM